MRRFLILFISALFLCIPAARALDVTQVRFGVHDDRTRLVLDLDGAADFRAFVMDSPVRLIIDLPQCTWRAGDIGHPQNAGVLGVRYGNLPQGTSRIVFDMNRPVSIQEAFMLPRGGGKPDRLVIDFSGVPPSLFSATKGKTFGGLGKSGSPAPAEQTSRTYSDPTPPQPKPERQQEQEHQEPRPAASGNYDKPLVIIDPGHGGVDPGASGAGLKEKNVVLGLAKALRDELENSGRYRVKMTRDTDIFIPLAGRVKFAREHEGDLFVSIHADSINKPGVGGASIYTLSEKASDAQTAKLAARENKADLIAGLDLSVEDQDVANILVDLAMRDTMNQSKFFANKLVGILPDHGVRLLERPHRYAGFAVLKAPDIPSVLVEAGFMSNNTEAKRLNSPEHRARFSKAMRRGIDAYFEQLRQNGR